MTFFFFFSFLQSWDSAKLAEEYVKRRVPGKFKDIISLRECVISISSIKDISFFYIYGFYLVTQSSNLIPPRFWSLSFGLENPLDSSSTKSNLCLRQVPGQWGCCLQFYCEQKGHVKEQLMRDRRVTMSLSKLLQNPVDFTAVMFASGSKVLHAVG